MSHLNPSFEGPGEGASNQLPDIRDLGLEELEARVAEAGERSFRAKQIAGWLYGRGAESFDAMLDLPKPFREYLKQHFKIE